MMGGRESEGYRGRKMGAGGVVSCMSLGFRALGCIQRECHSVTPHLLLGA
jgi:hypothetical protein